VHILQLSEDPAASFFAVFDGHGGSKVAQYAAQHLPSLLVKRPEYKQQNYALALQESFLEVDSLMRITPQLKDEVAGCTAVAVLIKDKTIWCANAGDSRAIGGVGGRAVALSTDHKPWDEIEFKRITKAGGFVENNRVNGNLALSRALGDFVFKNSKTLPQNEQIVSAEPDVMWATMTEEWDFLLLACDGIWDILDRQAVCDFVTVRIGRNLDPAVICEQLMDRCLAPDCQLGGLGCDNMTVVLVCFLHGQPYSRLVSRCLKLTSSLPSHQSQAKPDDDENSDDDMRSVLHMER